VEGDGIAGIDQCVVPRAPQHGQDGEKPDMVAGLNLELISINLQQISGRGAESPELDGPVSWNLQKKLRAIFETDK
jgi:hypothetical protein